MDLTTDLFVIMKMVRGTFLYIFNAMKAKVMARLQFLAASTGIAEVAKP